MALQKNERHPIDSVQPEFTGYWAYQDTKIAWTKLRAAITLGLYYSPADYIAAADKNILRVYPTTFIISGQDFVDIFLNPNLTQTQMAMLIFAFIKSYVEEEGMPPYFADAEIVP